MAKRPIRDIKGSIFDAVRYARTAAGIREYTNRSRRWYKKAIKNLYKEYNVDRKTNVMVDYLSSKNAKKFAGKMYMYFYNPKHRRTLPYYDKFPLIFILEFYDDGFLGINLHYLPLRLRLKLFDALLTLRSDDNYNEVTRLRLTYAILKKLKKFKIAKPTIKRYLTSHVMSKIKEVPAEDCEIALFLPVQDFKKASAAKVWKESRKKIR